ncbi:unnamed protein product [Schistocephalus solidus]|uniref:Zinc finger protein n=1 Tax=Schistocephalus solidus TaxID=70667 RepID=A0A183SIL4_SCHSO|nr:unnamed protein product [Schistocephalus solidus]
MRGGIQCCLQRLTDNFGRLFVGLALVANERSPSPHGCRGVGGYVEAVVFHLLSKLTESTMPKQVNVRRLKPHRHLVPLHKYPFKCASCAKPFPTVSHLNLHLTFVHRAEFEKCGVSDVPQFQCPHCSKSYSLAANLRTHINSIHKPPKPLACAHCNKSYDHPSLLHRHVLQIHNVDPTKTPAYSKVANTLSRFTCEHCGQFYTSPTNLGRHLRLVHGAPAKVLTTALFKRTCTLCKRHFSSYSHLRNHIECFHKGDVAFRCHDCDVVFTSAPSLQKHKLQFHEGSVSTDGLPTGQDTFDCELCPSKFACRSHLEDHMRFTHN